jgi:glutamate N-acetyltransferase / amino-acid N-acetyltransferase
MCRPRHCAVATATTPFFVPPFSTVCNAVAAELGLAPGVAVLPSSTGVIGWQLPVGEMLKAILGAVDALQHRSILGAAKGICTTDLYPKVSSAEAAGGRFVGIAKGAGMIEPNMATMLAYVVTDVALPRTLLRELLSEVVDGSFNSISVDSDQSTSDTVAMVSSGVVPFDADDEEAVAEVRAALVQVCGELAELVVRNGEGCNHLIRVRVRGALDPAEAKGVGKAIVNSPLFKCAPHSDSDTLPAPTNRC